MSKYIGILVLLIPFSLTARDYPSGSYFTMNPERANKFNGILGQVQEEQSREIDNTDSYFIERTEFISKNISSSKTSDYFYLPDIAASKSVNASGSYYFSPDGDDSNNGTTPDQAWRSISKLNSLIHDLQPGDVVYFERGGVWNEASISISGISGTSSNPITFRAYGSGKAPVITGGKDLSGEFTQNGNIWTHSGIEYRKSDYIKNNAGLLINDRFNRVSIHPDEGYFSTNSKGNNTLNDGSNSWADGELEGGQVSVKAENWDWSVENITWNSGSSIGFEDLEYNMKKDRTYYFLQNIEQGLDNDGEWVFDNSNLKVFYTGNLNAKKVEFPVKDTVMNIKNADNLVFSEIEFRAANGILVNISGGENINFGNCIFRVAGTGFDIDDTRSIEFSDNNFEYIHTNGITAKNISDLNIYDNHFKHIHTVRGMNNDYDNWSSSIAIANNSGDVQVMYNTFDTVMIAFQTHWADGNWNFERNFVKDYAYILGDVGAVYSGGDWRTDVKKTIRKNIFIDAHHDMEGTDGSHIGGFGHGVYWDYNSNGIVVDSNTFINSNAAIYSNRNKLNKAINNKFINSAKDLEGVWSNQVYMDNLIDGTDDIANHTFIDNIFILGKNPDERAFGYHCNSSKSINWGSLNINSNIYQDPFGGNKVHREIDNYSDKGNYSISEMCSRRQYDCNSVYNPLNHDYSDVTGISQDEFVKVAYNPSRTTETFDLGNTYIDLEGNHYPGKILLDPYETRILFYYSEGVTEDNEAPTIPQNLRTAEISSNSVKLSWDKSEDNISVKAYNIFINGELYGTSGSNSKNVTDLDPETDYTFRISAYDYSSNESSQSGAISVTTKKLTDDEGVDNSPPTIPQGLKANDIGRNDVSLSWNPATDNTAVSGYNIYANGLRKATVSTTGYVLDKLNYGTTYNITVTAFDAAGNESEESSILKITTLNQDGSGSEDLYDARDLPEISFIEVNNSEYGTETVAQIKSLKRAEIIEMGVRFSEDENFFSGVQVLSAERKKCISFNDERIRDNLQVFYNFSEGKGSKIRDISNLDDPLNLFIDDPGNVRWMPGQGLKVTGNTLISSETFPGRLIDSISRTNEITLEAWVKPSEINQDGPARIFTLSSDHFNRAFTVGQDGNNSEYDYVVRLATSNTDPNGVPEANSAKNFRDIDFHHIVFTRNSDGIEKLYINGKQLYYGYREGDLSSWGSENRLALANEMTGERPWTGTYFLVAAYNTALSEEEVLQNHEAGFGKIRFSTDYENLEANTQYFMEPYVVTDKGTRYGEVTRIITPDLESLEDKNPFNAKVYPNPNKGDFTLYFENESSEVRFARIRVSDITGKLIYQKDLPLTDIFFGREERISLDPSRFKSGIYFLTLTMGGETATQKLMIGK